MCKKLVVLALVAAVGVFALAKFGHKLSKKDASLETQIHEQEQILASLDGEISKHLRKDRDHLAAERDRLTALLQTRPEMKLVRRLGDVARRER